MTASTPSLPHNPPAAPCVADVLSELRALCERDPDIIYLEAHELRAAVTQRGCEADLATVESAAGWLALDGLEIVG